MATTATLVKPWKSKSKCKALTLRKLLDSEADVPAEYEMAKQYCAHQTQNPEVTVGNLAEWAFRCFSMFHFKPNAMNGQQLQHHYMSLWSFVMNYCFPAMGFNVCCVDSMGNPICYTVQPATGMGTGCTNRATEPLTKLGVKLSGAEQGFIPCDFTYTKDGQECTHKANSVGSILDVMCHYDRISTGNAASTTVQQKFAECKQSHTFAFCGVPDYAVVKKYATGGGDAAGARVLMMESKSTKECLVAVKLGVGYGTEYGTVFFNWADRDHADPLRLWLGPFKSNAYRVFQVLETCADSEDAGNKFIPETFKGSIAALAEMPQTFDGVSHVDYDKF